MPVCAPVQAFAGEDGKGCTCRATDGSKIAEGATACIRSAKGMVMARCERELNNTSWKFLDQPCPTAYMTPLPPVFTSQLQSARG